MFYDKLIPSIHQDNFYNIHFYECNVAIDYVTLLSYLNESCKNSQVGYPKKYVVRRKMNGNKLHILVWNFYIDLSKFKFKIEERNWIPMLDHMYTIDTNYVDLALGGYHGMLSNSMKYNCLSMYYEYPANIIEYIFRLYYWPLFYSCGSLYAFHSCILKYEYEYYQLLCFYSNLMDINVSKNL